MRTYFCSESSPWVPLIAELKGCGASMESHAPYALCTVMCALAEPFWKMYQRPKKQEGGRTLREFPTDRAPPPRHACFWRTERERTRGITGADASGVPSCCGGWAFQQPNTTAMRVDYFGRMAEAAADEDIIDATTSLVVERNGKLPEANCKWLEWCGTRPSHRVRPPGLLRRGRIVESQSLRIPGGF
ncbi:hypothetical protein Pelo_8038 [Pelomyxa schiedti]|nr:hypothetical protein Pelo_8038 [Pelomyxa schiedti]